MSNCFCLLFLVTSLTFCLSDEFETLLQYEPVREKTNNLDNDQV